MTRDNQRAVFAAKMMTTPTDPETYVEPPHEASSRISAATASQTPHAEP